MLEAIVSNEGLFNALSESARGELIGVFSSGVYFRINGKVLMLHDISFGTLPFGIAVEGIDKRCKELGLEAGMKLSLERGVFSTENGELKLRLKYLESSSKPVIIECIPAFAKKAEDALQASGRSALSAFAPCEPEKLAPEDIEDIFARAGHKGISLLVPAMAACDTELMEEALLKLIGLGRGLTPSFDDFLCGALFVLHYAVKNWKLELPCVVPLSDFVKKITPERTNVYSACYLHAAAAGEDFSLMRSCLENCGGLQAQESFERLMNVGGSSGCDMLSGMCFAANYILKQRQFTL